MSAPGDHASERAGVMIAALPSLQAIPAYAGSPGAPWRLASVPGRRAETVQHRLRTLRVPFSPRSCVAFLSPGRPRIAFNPHLLRCLVLVDVNSLPAGDDAS